MADMSADISWLERGSNKPKVVISILIEGKSCRRPSRYVPYKGTFVPYNGTFGASDQGQTLDV